MHNNELQDDGSLQSNLTESQQVEEKASANEEQHASAHKEANSWALARLQSFFLVTNSFHDLGLSEPSETILLPHRGY